MNNRQDEPLSIGRMQIHRHTAHFKKDLTRLCAQTYSVAQILVTDRRSDVITNLICAALTPPIVPSAQQEAPTAAVARLG